MEDKERWKKIKLFPDYSVSSWGRVKRSGSPRSLGNPPIEKILSPYPSKGYLTVHLYRDGKQFTFPVHKLVTENFQGPCPPGKEVNHKDGIKSNCRNDNLEYLTPEQNREHAMRMGLRYRKLDREQVAKIKTLLREVRQIDLARRFGVSTQTIYLIKTGKHVFS